LPVPLLQALAALAAHAESGEVLAERVFSARHLGGSKALVTLRGRLERLAGPLAEIGIREGASVTLLGGGGALRAADGEIVLPAFAPFLGLAREAVENLREIDFPAGGLSRPRLPAAGGARRPRRSAAADLGRSRPRRRAHRPPHRLLVRRGSLLPPDVPGGSEDRSPAS